MKAEEILSREQTVLGDLLVWPKELLPEVVKAFGDLGESVFYSQMHRAIYKGIVELDEMGKPISPKLVWFYLKGKKLKEAVAKKYLFELIDQGEGKSISEEFAKQLKDEAVRRQIGELALRTAEKVKTEDQGTLDIVEEAQEGFTRLGKSLGEEPRLRTARELLETSSPEVECLVGGGLLPKHGYTMLAAKAKEGKTGAALNMVLCLAADLPFLTRRGKREGFPVAGPKKTLYLLREADEDVLRFLRKQKRGLEEKWEKDLTKALDLIHPYRPKATYLDLKKGLRELRKLLEDYRPDLVVIDPLSKFLTGDMNKMETATKVSNVIDELDEEFGCAFLLLTHFRKTGKNEAEREDIWERIIGSSGWRNSYVSGIAMERKDRRRSKNIKKFHFERRGEPLEPIIVERDPDNLIWEQITAEEAFEGTSTVRGLVEILEGLKQGAKYSLIAEVASEKFGVSKTRIAELLKKGEEQRLISKKNEKYYALSQEKLF